MKLVTDPANADNVLGYIDDGFLFAFDKLNRPIQIGGGTPADALQKIKEWQAKQTAPSRR